jgi:hypothetical protein
MKYRYHLLKYAGPASRWTCPNCGRKHCFAPYVDDNNEPAGEQYGRCNHESSCGYVKYPPSNYDPARKSHRKGEDWREAPAWLKDYKSKSKPSPRIRPEPSPEPPEGICTIPMETVLKTVRTNPLSDFLRFLCTIADTDAILRSVQEYYIGVARENAVVFYQIDEKGRCRTGKVMKYNPETGHRIKDDSVKTPITWVHSLLKQQGVLPKEWELSQCLFGQHLLNKYPNKPVILVEAEKTAIIGSILCPKGIWLATGGKGQLNDRVEVLYGRKILAFPDVDGYTTWKEKADERPYLGVIVSDYLERTATAEDRAAHIDIADLLIRWQHQRLGTERPSKVEPIPPEELSTNPVFLEVQKYISPEYHKEVLALIEELDLEFISATKIVKLQQDEQDENINR